MKIGLDEYLHTSFENPDPEFVEGEVVERNDGSWPHSRTMLEVAFGLIGSGEPRTGLWAATSLRLKVAANRVRVADVAAFESEPDEEVSSKPPLIVAEVISPEDRFCALVQKLQDYRQWGAKHIWVADPEDRKLFTYGSAGIHEVNGFELPEYGIVLTKPELLPQRS